MTGRDKPRPDDDARERDQDVAQDGANESDAGADSPHLRPDEKEQAAQHAAPPALVIHEIVREEGEQELRKSTSAIAWSGLAAGMSMGFSFICLGIITASLPDTPWRHLVASAGYTVGFVITVLGRQELFTESTLSGVLPLLVRRDRATLMALLRFWGIVLAGNLFGATAFAWLLTHEGLFDSSTTAAFEDIAAHLMGGDFVTTLLQAMLAGWLIALMVWVMPSARSAKLLVILLLTYVVALCGLPHVIAGTSEAAYAVFTQRATWQQAMQDFLLPTLLGNTLGGVALVAMLNHAPLADELKHDAGEQHDLARQVRREAHRL